MRDVTLYEHPEQGLSALPFDGGEPIPAVVGITVAEVEADVKALYNAGNTNSALRAFGAKVRRERDEARRHIKYLSEYLGVGYDPEEGMFEDGSLAPNVGMFPNETYGEVVEQRDRCREALKRIAALHALHATYKAAWIEAVHIAREALGDD